LANGDPIVANNFDVEPATITQVADAIVVGSRS
jgi:hypothetical protein